jgi:hypothetical protein
VTYSKVNGIACANFSGINGYISSDGIDIPYRSEPRTISYWVRLNADATGYDTSTIWGYGGGGDKQNPGGKYFSHTILPNAFHNLCGYDTWDTSDVYIEHTFSTEKWYHICQTSTDGQTFITYVNGIMIGSIKHENLNLPEVNATVFALGRTGRRTGDQFGNYGLQGNLAGFRIYDRALIQEEITLLAQEFTPTGEDVSDTPNDELVGTPYGYRLKMSCYDLDPVWETEFVQDDLTATGKARTWTRTDDSSSKIIYTEDFGGWTEVGIYDYNNYEPIPGRTGFGTGDDPYPCWDDMEVAEITVIE